MLVDNTGESWSVVLNVKCTQIQKRNCALIFAVSLYKYLEQKFPI